MFYYSNYTNKILKTVTILLILNCLTTCAFILRQKRDAPVGEAAAAAAVNPALPPPPPPPAAAAAVSGPMNAAAAQMTAAAQPIMAHMDKLAAEGTAFMKDGVGLFSDFCNPFSWFG